MSDKPRQTPQQRWRAIATNPYSPVIDHIGREALHEAADLVDELEQQAQDLLEQNSDLVDAHNALIAERDRLREALEWYADKSNWMDDFVTVSNVSARGGNRETIYRGDGGDRARKALEVKA